MNQQAMRSLDYSVVDVFAERPLEGNPLAIFHDARGLSTADMQALARETNLSETTFVLPADDPEQDRVQGVTVRIFTTQEELPFAGHPTLGTASWLHGNFEPTAGQQCILLRLPIGPIAVSFDPAVAGVAGVYGAMQQRPPEFGATHDRAETARVLNLPEEDLMPGFAPQTVSTGNPFCIVALRSTEALGRLDIPQRSAVPWLRQRGIRWFYVVAPTADPEIWRARMQWHGGEDPATGSAAGPCLAWLVRSGLVPAGTRVTLQQGVEMGRPSRLTLWASAPRESAMDIFVGGRTIPVARGQFLLPL